MWAPHGLASVYRLQLIAGIRRYPKHPSVARGLKFLRSSLLRFESEVATWSSKGSGSPRFRSITNIVNEVAAAKSFLDRMKSIELLRYEFPISGTKKTLDFLVIDEEGRRAWIDVKTVAPAWQDDDEAWKRFQALAAEFGSSVRPGPTS